MNAGFTPGFRTSRGENYGLVIFMTVVAAIIVYSGWRYSQANEDGDRVEAPIAGIIIGFLVLVAVCLYTFLRWRRRRRMAPSRRLTTMPAPERWQEQEIHGFNRQHWGAGQHWGRGQHWDNRENWGSSPNTPAVSHMHDANSANNASNSYSANVENAAADNSFPEKPPPAYPGGKYDRILRDPNPNSMHNV